MVKKCCIILLNKCSREVQKVKNRSKAFFVNGGAGRVISSIPAFEMYEKENPDDDFIIICEGGTDMFHGHPTLHKRVFDNWHKGLFEEKIKSRDCVSLEPYRIWEYYNQKANITQAFDIEMSSKGVRPMNKPTLVLNTPEGLEGAAVVREVKEKTSKQRLIVFQPFGRSTQPFGDTIADPGGRSFRPDDVVKVIKKLQEKYAIILMSEFPTDYQKLGCNQPVAQPEGAPLRHWAGIINAADCFIGCDSVGQHMAYALDVPSVVVVGSTYPENISYPDSKTFQVLDLGEGKRRYDPIRITMEDEYARAHDRLMYLDDAAVREICKEVDAKVAAAAGRT
jgi:hypothetical protein